MRRAQESHACSWAAALAPASGLLQHTGPACFIWHSVYTSSFLTRLPSWSIRAGEKAQLRKERVTAKRAARAASRGFDLACINKELQDLVTRQGDMKVRLPVGGLACNIMYAGGWPWAIWNRLL